VARLQLRTGLSVLRVHKSACASGGDGSSAGDFDAIHFGQAPLGSRLQL